MAAGGTIEGLMEWAQREPWVDDFDAVFERHCGPACRAAGVARENLARTIGADLMTALFGWVFEDFVASRQGERNVADEYLKRRGWKESTGAKAYIKALRNSTASLYEVSDVVVGESFLARDLMRDGEPVRVQERTATRTLRQWDYIAARIVTVLGKTALTGGLLSFPRPLADDALARIGRARDLDEMTKADELLAGAAFLLSNVWLDDMLRRALGPALPQMQNTDREPLEFITVRFPLAPETNAPSIVATLDALQDLRKDSDSRWAWVRPKAQPGKPAKGKTAEAAMMEDGGLLLGHIELTAKAVTLSANSEARAARGRAMLERALAGRVRPSLMERQTVKQMMASEEGHAPPRLSISPEEERRIVHQAMTNHYRETLDDPIPMLGGQSPRKAVRTPNGRAKVVEWLKTLENSSARHKPGDAMAGYDFAWLWRELGLGEDRR